MAFLVQTAGTFDSPSCPHTDPASWSSLLELPLPPTRLGTFAPRFGDSSGRVSGLQPNRALTQLHRHLSYPLGTLIVTYLCQSFLHSVFIVDQALCCALGYSGEQIHEHPPS